MTTADANVGGAGTDIVVPADLLPVVSYHGLVTLPAIRLKVLKCGTPSCN